MLISTVCCAQKKWDYIVFYKSYTNEEETNLYTTGPIKFDYNVQYNNLKKANVRADVIRAIKNKDYYIIALTGNTVVFPGIKEKDWIKYTKNKNFKVIAGTSDVIDLNKPPLQGAAGDYATLYNKLLLAYLKNHKMP